MSIGVFVSTLLALLFAGLLLGFRSVYGRYWRTVERSKRRTPESIAGSGVRSPPPPSPADRNDGREPFSPPTWGLRAVAVPVVDAER